MATGNGNGRRTTAERDSLDEYARDCGRRVRFRRMALEITQEELAARLSVTQSALSLWEKGERLPSDYQRGRIAFELDRDVMELYPPVGRISPPQAVGGVV
jgi:transcriptional regulator with XRE-family HTH domain